MKLVLFGATGHIGSHVLRLARERGHEVSVLVRSPAKLPADAAAESQVLLGSLLDPMLVGRACQGAEAAIVTLAAGNGLLARFDAVALPLFEQQGPKRVVSMVGASVRMPGDPDSLGLGLMTAMMRMVPGALLEDAEGHARRLAASSLDWTLVRSSNFSTAEPTGRVVARLDQDLPLTASITRADLADFIVTTATGGHYLHQAPMVANG
jgi:uncharacterized protein YbjT (DUF2867 family)